MLLMQQATHLVRPEAVEHEGLHNVGVLQLAAELSFCLARGLPRVACRAGSNHLQNHPGQLWHPLVAHHCQPTRPLPLPARRGPGTCHTGRDSNLTSPKMHCSLVRAVLASDCRAGTSHMHHQQRCSCTLGRACVTFLPHITFAGRHTLRLGRLMSPASCSPAKVLHWLTASAVYPRSCCGALQLTGCSICSNMDCLNIDSAAAPHA